MRRKKTLSISEVLKEYKKEMNIDNKLKEVEVINAWEDIAGKAIAKRTNAVYVRNRILYVETNSPVVRNELLMIREIIKQRINEKAGESLIDSVVLR